MYWVDRECILITGLCYDEEDNNIKLWSECQGDDYYSGTVMRMKYCPKCGRKLA